MKRMPIEACSAVTLALLFTTVVLAQPPEGGPPGGPGGDRRGPPSPEQFVERAMAFDADGDGKLDRSELTKLATYMQSKRMRGGPGGPPGGPGGPDGPRAGGPRRGPGGEGGFGGDGRRGPPPGEPRQWSRRRGAEMPNVSRARRRLRASASC